MAEPLRVLNAHDKYGLPLAYAKNGRSLATGGFDGTLKVWSTDSGEEIGILDGHDQSVNCGCITNTGALLTGSTDTTLRLWDLLEADCLKTLEGHKKTVTSVAAHPRQAVVASASYDATVRVWDLETEEELQILKGHDKNVTTVRFLTEGRYLASGGLGDDLLVWDVATGEEVARLSGHRTAVVGVTHGTEQTFWSLGHEGVVKGWSARDFTPVSSFALPGDAAPSGVAADWRGTRIAVTRDHGVLVLDPSGEIMAEHALKIKGVYAPRFSPDGRGLAIGGADGKVRLYAVD